MLKIILQSFVAIIIFIIGVFKEKMHKALFYCLVIIAIVILVATGFMVYFGDRLQREEQNKLKGEINALSQRTEAQKNKIDELLSENSKFRLEIKEQSNKIDNLIQEVKRLAKLLEDISVGKFAETDSYTKAKNLYATAMKLMDQGKNKEAADKFLEFREIAIKERVYEAAAISSLIAAFRFKDMGEDVPAAKLQSEAGDFYMKLNRYDEALIWKKDAKSVYETNGLTAEAETIGKEIKTIDLLLK
jgi:tetratricopeptide (TPR) repeat protein